MPYNVTNVTKLKRKSAVKKSTRSAGKNQEFRVGDKVQFGVMYGKVVSVDGDVLVVKCGGVPYNVVDSSKLKKVE
jgi:hypothetical protein